LQSKRRNAAERASPQANLPLLKLSWSVPPPSRSTWATGGITSSEGGVSSRLPRLHPHTNPPLQPFTEAPEKPIVTVTRETAGPQKPELKSTAAPKRACGKSKKKAAASVKTAAATPSLVVSTQSPTSPLEEISDLDHLPLHACVEPSELPIMSATAQTDRQLVAAQPS